MFYFIFSVHFMLYCEYICALALLHLLTVKKNGQNPKLAEPKYKLPQSCWILCSAYLLCIFTIDRPFYSDNFGHPTSLGGIVSCFNIWLIVTCFLYPVCLLTTPHAFMLCNTWKNLEPLKSQFLVVRLSPPRRCRSGLHSNRSSSNRGVSAPFTALIK